MLLGLLVLLQAFLAGRGLYLDSDLFDVHRYVGIAAVLVALLLVALTFALVGAAGAGRAIFLISAVIFILAILQLILGFSGRDSTQAAAWHVLNGVLIFGLTTAENVLVFRRDH